MKKPAAILKFLLFALFFSVAAIAITISILIDEIKLYHENKASLHHTRQLNEKLEDLIDQSAAQIHLIEKDPNILKRLSYVTLGRDPADANSDVAYPQNNLSSKQIKNTLEDIKQKQSPAEPNIPKWVQRCSRYKTRLSLFLAGTALVLVTFIFFATPVSKKNKPPSKN
jgi:hypothetical protein